MPFSQFNSHASLAQADIHHSCILPSLPGIHTILTNIHHCFSYLILPATTDWRQISNCKWIIKEVLEKISEYIDLIIWLPQFHTSSAALNTVETHGLLYIPNSD